ncbi:MAG: methyl-accepting chemotaxis protein [Austwickia sp.]|nr:methyl-accepting chemotaxis protein [Austwickia sp.]
MRLSIRRMIILLSVALVAFTAIALSAASGLRTNAFANDAEADMVRAVDERVGATTHGMYNVLATQGESLNQRVATDLRVAQEKLAAAGGFRLGAGTLAWEAKNQTSGAVSSVRLPQPMVGSTPLRPERSAQAVVPVVDATKAAVGDTATIFQRMNDAGDMLRVATNILGTDGNRVIGTSIAAKGADGAANPVLAAVLAGKTYTGTANVVGSWYVTQYAPLFDEGDRIIGMLYVGVKQESVATLRDAILGATVGAHGQVLVLGTTGANKGAVRLAKDAAQQGQNLLGAKGQDGTAYVEAALTKAATLKPGESAAVPFVAGDGQPSKIWTVYYAPWDWTIAVITRDADFAAPVERLNAGRQQLLVTLIVLSVGVAAAGLAAALALGRRITAPLVRLRDRMAEIADGDGDLTARVEDHDRDEVGQLGGAFNRFVAKVATAVAAVTQASDGVHRAAGEIAAVTRDLDDSATRSAAQTERAQTASAEIVESVATAAAATEQMSASIRDIAGSAARAAEIGAEATQLAGQTEAAVSALGQSSAEIGAVIKSITSIAEQTNLLALNATIEAARAGEAGKGFAVVANEVKELARETAQATDDISRRIEHIQADTGRAVDAITRIAAVVRDINDAQATIATAVEEQSATTAEVSRAIGHASHGVDGVRTAISSVNDGAKASATAIRSARHSADESDELAGLLREQLSAFRI